MDANRLTQDLKFASQLGVTLNLEERVKLELALLKLNENQNFENILFWGKIEGNDRDYYIALGLNFKGHYEFPQKSFFWTTDDFKFAPLELPNLEHKDRVDAITTPFTGNPAEMIYEVPPEIIEKFEKNLEEKAQKKENGNLEDTDDEADLERPKNFVELDRLSYVVRAIDNECSTLPIGALKLSPLHELRYNDTFKGLSMQEALSLKNYQHFRPAQSEEMKEFINRGDAIFHSKFLDPLENDLPNGCWSIHTDSSKLNVTVRNLVWPGYFTYHRATTNIYGFCYFGNGLKNTDLAFLI